MLEINYVLRKIGHIVHGDSMETPMPRYTEITAAMHALEEYLRRLNGELARERLSRNLREKALAR